MKLLKPNGIMVGPFNDKLLRIRRSPNSQEFTCEQLSGVRFAALVRPARGDRALVQSAEEQLQNEKIKSLAALCSIDAPVARELLEKASWDLNQARENYLKAKAEEAQPPEPQLPEGDPADVITVDAWLQSIKLDRYAAAIKEAGYDELQFLQDALEEDIDEALVDIKMKKPHIRTFKKSWRLLVDPPATSERSELDDGAQTEDAGGAAGPTEGHGNLQSGFGLPVISKSEKTKLFGSVRYKNGKILPEAVQLQCELAKAGLELTLVDMTAGGDIDANVFGGIEKADTFVVFGTVDYGENTGNPACTYYESKFAQSYGKRIILLRMIPFGVQFEQLQARQLFGVNKLSLEWIQGEKMPGSLVKDIVKAVNDTSTAPKSR